MCQGWLEDTCSPDHGFSTATRLSSALGLHGEPARQMAQGARAPWRQDIASLNYVLPTCGSRSQRLHPPGPWPDHVANKKADVRLYLLPDANCLLSALTTVSSRNYVNVMWLPSTPPQWLTMDRP
ncbi:MAG: hypothetical protein ACLT5P_06025 [Flavonifractor plautii]